MISYQEPIDINAEINGIIIIKGYELSQDEKTKIAEYLIKNNIPGIALNAAFRKYVDGDERLVGYVNQVAKIKEV